MHEHLLRMGYAFLTEWPLSYSDKVIERTSHLPDAETVLPVTEPLAWMLEFELIAPAEVAVFM